MPLISDVSSRLIIPDVSDAFDGNPFSAEQTERIVAITWRSYTAIVQYRLILSNGTYDLLKWSRMDRNLVNLAVFQFLICNRYKGPSQASHETAYLHAGLNQ